jgi:hypothetical protein
MCQLVDNEFNIVGNLFSVTILPTVLVDQLKKTIKAENPDDFGHISAKKLHLWKLQKPWPVAGDDGGISAVNKFLERFRKGKDARSLTQQLNPAFFVSDYFNESLPVRHLHLIVQDPVSGAGDSLHYML